MHRGDRRDEGETEPEALVAGAVVETNEGQNSRSTMSAGTTAPVLTTRRTNVASSAAGWPLECCRCGASPHSGLLSGVVALCFRQRVLSGVAEFRNRWWAAVDSNHLPPRYQHGALPVELAALAGWQGRKDSNPRPSVLETDALTRLSYAPMADQEFTQPPVG